MQSLPWSLHSVRSGQCFNWMHDGKNRKWWKLPRGATVSQERAEDPSYTEGWSIHKILFNLCSARITHHKCACGGFRYRPGLKLLFQRLIHPHLVGTTRQAHICPSDEPEGRAVDCSTLQSPIFLFWWSQLSDVRCVCVCVGVCVCVRVCVPGLHGLLSIGPAHRRAAATAGGSFWPPGLFGEVVIWDSAPWEQQGQTTGLLHCGKSRIQPFTTYFLWLSINAEIII